MTPKPAAIPTGELTFKGLELCDQCGAPLELENRLWGLCENCQVAPPGVHLSPDDAP